MAQETAPKVIEIPSRIVIREFAVKLNLPAPQVMAELIKNGIMSSQNEEIDFETAAIIAEDFGYQAVRSDAALDAAPTFMIDQWVAEENAKFLTPRPPVVVILGHVDHGKTKLLDTIRSTKVVESEAGGITQAIGAYQATHRDRAITFIDTPGHEAFSAMRSRGAKVADVAILVVAADDGVKPQTKEAIDILTHAGLNFVVAINKIDKADANPDKVKQELAALNIAPEEFGGKIVMVPISAKDGTNINELLDAVLLVADVEKGKMVANPDGRLLGTVIESHVDSGEGPVATVLVHNGTLRAGLEIQAGNAFGKIKTLKDSFNHTVTEAPPSLPVRILGLKGLPQVGDSLTVATDLKGLKKKVKKSERERPLNIAPAKEPAESEQAKTVTLNLVIKADRLGSLEAIRESLKKLKHEEVRILVVTQGLGNITEADVLRAETSQALLLGFNITVTPSAQAVAKGRDLPITTFTVIYDLLDHVKAAAEALLKPEVFETPLGSLSVLAIFRTDPTSMIVGGKVTDGKIALNAKVRVLRKGAPVAAGTIVQLQQNRQTSKEVVAGLEAGIKFQGPPLIQAGDTLQAFTVEEKRKSIA